MNSIKWKVNRLLTMGAREISYRLSLSLRAKLEQRGFGLAKTVVPGEKSGAIFCNPLPRDVDTVAYIAAADRILAGHFDVFTLRDTDLGFPPNWNRDPLTGIEVPLVLGKTVDCRDQAVVGNIKYLWEPNRHQELVTLAQAWYLTGETKYADGCRTLLESWFEQCPYPLGVNWYSSHEHSVRLVNWALAWGLLASKPLASQPFADDALPHPGPTQANDGIFAGSGGAVFRRRWLDSIYQHCHFIAGHFSRYSSANNHLFGEYMGLFISSVVWPCWPESVHWRDTGKAGLEEEAVKQNAPDGMNREQAIWYHHEVADMMLLSGLIGQANEVKFSSAYWQRLQKMLELIAGMMDVSGNMPMIGDSDDAVMVRFSRKKNFNVYRSLLATGAVLFGIAHFAAKAGKFDDKSRWLLGDGGGTQFEELKAVPQANRHVADYQFPQGGYYVLGSRLDTPTEIRLIMDAGPVGYLSIAAHGHADALALTMSVAGHGLLIDPGTYVYLDEPEWRQYFRGTAAHNTVRVDGEDQSVSGGPFIWSRKANVRVLKFLSEPDLSQLIAEHDGYGRLRDPVVHRREVLFDKRASTIRVMDDLIGEGEHTVEWFWHFAETVAVSLEPGRVIARVPGWRVEMEVPDTCAAPVLLHGSVQPMGGWVSRSFGEKSPTSTVSWLARSVGNTSWETRIMVIREAQSV
jgi:hypothetical protein